MPLPFAEAAEFMDTNDSPPRIVFEVVYDRKNLGVFMPEFSGKVGVVTGAAGGIGSACAAALVREGAFTILLDRDEAGLARATTAIGDGAQTASYALDLTDQRAVEDVFADIHRKQGRVDILVNNVGQSARERRSEFHESAPEIWDFVIAVSLKTTMLCTRQVIEGMRARRSGKIVNISSDVAFRGDVLLADYSAAKAGVVGFTRALAKESGPFGINVNAVCPGATMAAGFAANDAAMQKEILAITPIGFIAEPADIANAVVFSASEKSRYMTGHALIVNGGRGL